MYLFRDIYNQFIFQISMLLIQQFLLQLFYYALINFHCYIDMEKVKKDRTKTVSIPPLHTYMIKQYDHICDTFQVQLESGTAEINGIELMKFYPHQYTVPCCIPVFTWEGCVIKANWKQEDGTKPSDEDWRDLTQFHSHQDPMIKYLELHYELTCLRKLCLEQLKEGPRLAIVGSELNATQLVSKVMLNYAGKLNMRPILVDLDIQNSIFIDGTVGSMVFQYKISEDFFDRPQKISFFYGNRKIKRQSFLKQANLIAESINRKLEKQQKSYKQKGSNQQCPSFAAGVILHCPRILQKQDKKSQKELIYELIKIFKISHVLSVQDSEIVHSLSKKQPKIEKYNLTRLQGASSFVQLPKPLRTKINRYFQPQIIKTITIKISDIHLYELMEEQGKSPYCRQIRIQDEPISKSTISILYCENNTSESMEVKADRALSHPISCLAFIFRIGNQDITLHVVNQNFWEEAKNKLWMSMISQHF